VLKIQRRVGARVVLTISGRLRAANLGELSAVLPEGARLGVVLDLNDLVMVDGDAIRFLCACERDGIVLQNCPRYINAWMARERDQLWR
jgi:hypothetical protein